MIFYYIPPLQAEIEGLRSNSGGGGGGGPDSPVRRREVEMLKAELRSCRQRALREGARRAMARAGQGFAASVDAHSAGIRGAFDAVIYVKTCCLSPNVTRCDHVQHVGHQM